MKAASLDHSPIPARLERLYGPALAPGIWTALQRRLHDARALFPPTNRSSLWSEKDAVLITYGDSLLEPGLPPLRALDRFVREELDDAISLVHILPFFPYTSDDGFSVSDYSAVREDLGGWDDIRALGTHHDLMFDLVLNHCSASHQWFQQFLAGQEPGLHFFHTPSPDTDLSAVVRPRTHPLLTAFDTALGTRHVWTTFSADQVDLNFGHPDVLLAFIDLLLLYARHGARMIRLDAIAFLWKQPGTPSIHLPQTHEVVKLMRDVLEAVAPGVILLTETNVPHKENISYFGDGDEARMVYQFPLPPLLLHALRRSNPAALREWAASLDAPPPGCTFFNFTASHDGIGVRPLEGLVPPEEVSALADEIRATGGRVNERSRPDGSRVPYELNATYFSALRLPDDDDARHLRRFLLSQTLPMCLQGIPAFYLHSLTATPNDLEGHARTGQNRSINRRRWTRAELDPLLHNPDSPTAITLATLRQRLRLRATLPQFHPDVPQHILNPHPDVFAVKRDTLTAFHHFGNQTITLQGLPGTLLLADTGVIHHQDRLTLPPLSTAWLLHPSTPRNP